MAVTLTFDQFRARLQLTEEQEADAVVLEALQSWYDYGVTAVTKYAPMAPAAVSNLAVSMIGTYLLTQPLCGRATPIISRLVGCLERSYAGRQSVAILWRRPNPEALPETAGAGMKLWPFSRKAPVETRQQGGAGFLPMR